MARGGSPGGIAAIALGSFFLALAYTGKVQEVWAAAFGPSGSSDGGYNKDVYSPDPDNPETVTPDPNKLSYYLIGSCADKCAKDYTNWRILKGTKVIGNYCVDSKTSPNGVKILATGETAQKCTDITGGGENFATVTLNPAGGFRRQGG